MRTAHGNLAAPKRARPATTLAGALVLALSVGGGLAGAQEGSEPESSEPVLIRTQPPTAAEAEAWEENFLASEPQAKRIAAAKRPANLPSARVVALYGAARGFGVLGRRTVEGAASKLKRQLEPYRRLAEKPVEGAFHLVAVIATRCEGGRGKCRHRVSDSVIRRYLYRARRLGGRLVLDVQSGRSDFMWELDHLREWLRKPDVDLAIDPEWNVGPDGRPGETAGKVKAGKINDISAELARIVKRQGLPEKLLVIHEFHSGSIRFDARVKARRKVDVTNNFDGIGSPRAKRGAYRALSSERLFNGFSVFYRLDSDPLRPRAVLGLRPHPNYVMYQ